MKAADNKEEGYLQEKSYSIRINPATVSCIEKDTEVEFRIKEKKTFKIIKVAIKDSEKMGHNIFKINGTVLAVRPLISREWRMLAKNKNFVGLYSMGAEEGGINFLGDKEPC